MEKCNFLSFGISFVRNISLLTYFTYLLRHDEAGVIIPQQIHIAMQSGKIQNFKVIFDNSAVFVLLLY